MKMMGWKSIQAENLAQFIEMLQQVCRLEDYELVGNELYGLSRSDDGRHFIVVCLLENHGERWAYLLFDEAMHPYRYNCPHRFLEASDIPDTSLWRERCRWFGEDAEILNSGYQETTDINYQP